MYAPDSVHHPLEDPESTPVAPSRDRKSGPTRPQKVWSRNVGFLEFVMPDSHLWLKRC